MFLEILNFIAEYFGKAFGLMAEFNIGGFNLLSFFIVFAILDVLVSIFVLRVEGNIMFSENTWRERNHARDHAERDAYRRRRSFGGDVRVKTNRSVTKR